MAKVTWKDNCRPYSVPELVNGFRCHLDDVITSRVSQHTHANPRGAAATWVVSANTWEYVTCPSLPSISLFHLYLLNQLTFGHDVCVLMDDDHSSPRIEGSRSSRQYASSLTQKNKSTRRLVNLPTVKSIRRKQSQITEFLAVKDSVIHSASWPSLSATWLVGDIDVKTFYVFFLFWYVFCVFNVFFIFRNVFYF